MGPPRPILQSYYLLAGARGTRLCRKLMVELKT
jgi:hypothetical protein